MAPNRGALVAQDELSKKLGDQFRRIRESRQVGLRPLAADIGITVYCIRRHEAGRMMLRSDDLFRAAKALRVRPAELLYIGESDG